MNQIEISTEDLQRYPWQEIIAKAERKDCSLYAAPLFTEAERLKMEGDERGYQTLAFVAELSSLTSDSSQQRCASVSTRHVER